MLLTNNSKISRPSALVLQTRYIKCRGLYASVLWARCVVANPHNFGGIPLNPVEPPCHSLSGRRGAESVDCMVYIHCENPLKTLQRYTEHFWQRKKVNRNALGKAHVPPPRRLMGSSVCHYACVPY